MSSDMLSPHFSVKEFQCRCKNATCLGKQIKPKAGIVLLLEDIRSHFNRPVHLNCGLRCSLHNYNVGGEPNSQHLPMHACAADIVVEGISPDDVAEYAEFVIDKMGGCGRYDTFTHVDLRGTKARWDYRELKGGVK